MTFVPTYNLVLGCICIVVSVPGACFDRYEFLPFTVPSQPPQKVAAEPSSSQSIAVAWSPPPLYTLHGILQGYKVLYKPVRLDEG